MINKISGIYAIVNKQTGKQYIGSADNLGVRWSIHLAQLEWGTHCNTELQDDYNYWGFHNFHFEIREIIKDSTTKILREREQAWINIIGKSSLYNKYNADLVKSREARDVRKFVAYINNRWLVPIGTTKKDLQQYKIWRNEDKEEIISQAISAGLFKLFPCDVTFLRVIRLLEKSFGYTIETKQGVVETGRLTYRLVISYDENKADYKPAIETIADNWDYEEVSKGGNVYT